MDMPSHRSRSISISASPNDLDQLQSPALDDSKQDHPLISNSVTTDSTYREDHSAQRGEEEDDGRRLTEDHDYHDDGVSNIPSRDDADLINDIMNQKSSDEDYDFKLVETMDEDDEEHEGGMHPSDGSNQPAEMSATMTSSTTETVRGMHSNITSGASSQASTKLAAGNMPFHAPKLVLPHQIAALEKKNQVEQPHHYSVSNTNNPSWHSKHHTRETTTTSSYMYGQAGYYHNFHPLPPSSSTDQIHSTQSSIGTHHSKKRLLHVNDPDDGRAGGRYPVVVNMKRNKINDPNEGDVKNNVSEKANSAASFQYDPYNCVNHMQPHYTAPSTTNSGGEHRRNWSSCSTASSISAGGLSSSLSSSTSFDKSGQPFETKAMQNNDHMFGGQQQNSNLSQSSASYSKFDLLSMEDTSAISNRMFTANGKPFSTSPIMGAGSNSTASTVSSIAVGKKHQTENLNTNDNNKKLDPGVTPISKNTRRDRATVPLRHPHQHANTFFAETPAALSSAHNLTNATNNQLQAGNLIGGIKQRNMISVDVRESRDAPSSQELYRQNSFTPIPMNSSGDDIDDVHNMTIQPNLSWSLMGETSPLGEIDGLDPWSASVASKDPWSRGSAHDILCTLSPNSDTGLKSPCLSNVFDQPHPEERENIVKGGGQHHSYHHQQPHQSFPSSQTHNVAQPPHRYSQHDPHSSQSHNTIVNIAGRSPMKTNYQQDSMRRHIPPPTPMGSGWSSNHYIPSVTSSNHPPGIDHSGHVKSNHRKFMNGMPSNNYSVDIRDDVNSSRGESFFNSQVQHSFRPPAGGGGDRVINLRGRPMPSHHGSHHPPPPHHYESSHQAPPPLPPHHHHHHYPGSNRSPWGGRQVPAGGAHPNHSYHHLPTTASHSHMAPSSSQPVAGVVDTVHSRRKCAPLKPPIPSKFQGDIEKYKDATVPEFTNLVNYPTNVANKMAAMAGDGLKICVMCGSACPCSSLPKGKCKGGSDKDEGRALMQHHKQPPNAHKLNGTASSAQGCYAIIPTQNKGLCTFCDVNVWVVIQSGLEIKWCKGCKNFRPWAAFGDKGLATKCVRCRDRQREKYALQKEEKEKTRGDEISVIAEI